jgi:predicted transposase/invertase (TIGR01784 family)
MAHLHDTGYKFLFSHADLVRELLEVFAPPGVSELLDYATLRPETGNFITPAMKKREQDVVWSIELQGQRIYLYLLLEFQSSIDRGMPVRMMQYVAALYDHLLRSKGIDLSEGLPPVLPIVLYNGDTRWNHSTEIFDLIQIHPTVLTEFQPRLKFWLLDEGCFSEEYLEGLQRVMAAIFRMEHANDTEKVKQAIRHLGQMVIQSPYRKSIEKGVLKWMQYRLHQKLPELPILDVDEIMKGCEMLETNLDRIKANAIAEGVLLGELRGELRGELKGEIKGEIKGKSTLLERQLIKRFGSITEDTRDRLRNATSDQLELWAERILDAKTLAEVFSDH